MRVRPGDADRFCCKARLRAALGTLACGLAIAASPAQATMIAEWTFDGGSLQNTGAAGSVYDLAPAGTGPAPDTSSEWLSLTGDEANPGWLEVAGPGGMANWTLELRVRWTGSASQGQYQGFFSNLSPATADFSWQLESFDGVYQWRTWNGTYTIGAASGAAVWDHIVIRKRSGSTGDVWLNGVLVAEDIGANPGGLQNFRLGTNRNEDNFFAGELDDIRVYDESSDALIATLIPEPSTALLVGLGLFGVGRRRRAARHVSARLRAHPRPAPSELAPR